MPSPALKRQTRCAGGGVVGGEVTIRGALKDEIAGSRERAAIPDRVVLHFPARFLAHRIPGEQCAFAVLRILHRPADAETADGHCAGPGRSLREARADLHVRDVDEPGARAERHVLPVVRADRARPDHEIAGLIANVRRFDRPSRGEIDALGPRHLAGLLRGDELAGLAIEHIEEAVRRRSASAPCAACRRSDSVAMTMFAVHL